MLSISQHWDCNIFSPFSFWKGLSRKTFFFSVVLSGVRPSQEVTQERNEMKIDEAFEVFEGESISKKKLSDLLISMIDYSKIVRPDSDDYRTPLYFLYHCCNLKQE